MAEVEGWKLAPYLSLPIQNPDKEGIAVGVARRYPFPGDATFARDPLLYLAPRSFFARPNIGARRFGQKSAKFFARSNIGATGLGLKSEAQVARTFQASRARSGNQQQEQKSPNLVTTIRPSPGIRL